MDGMDKIIVYVLVKIGIIIMDDFVEQVVDDIIDVEGIDEECVG